jgi:hypothetical protein
MRGLSICFLCLLFAAPLAVATHVAAAGSCPNTKSGKCPVLKKKHDTRSQFTAEQREKMAVEFRTNCKKKYGASSRLVKIDYYKRQYICSAPGY